MGSSNRSRAIEVRMSEFLSDIESQAKVEDQGCGYVLPIGQARVRCIFLQ